MVWMETECNLKLKQTNKQQTMTRKHWLLLFKTVLYPSSRKVKTLWNSLDKYNSVLYMYTGMQRKKACLKYKVQESEKKSCFVFTKIMVIWKILEESQSWVFGLFMLCILHLFINIDPNWCQNTVCTCVAWVPLNLIILMSSVIYRLQYIFYWIEASNMESNFKLEHHKNGGNHFHCYVHSSLAAIQFNT